MLRHCLLVLMSLAALAAARGMDAERAAQQQQAVLKPVFAAEVERRATGLSCPGLHDYLAHRSVGLKFSFAEHRPARIGYTVNLTAPARTPLHFEWLAVDAKFDLAETLTTALIHQLCAPGANP
jgi:hypothetical protein